jgi:hypothetical protein
MLLFSSFSRVGRVFHESSQALNEHEHEHEHERQNDYWQIGLDRTFNGKKQTNTTTITQTFKSIQFGSAFQMRESWETVHSAASQTASHSEPW